MPRALTLLLAILAIAYAGICALLWGYQRHLLYFPQSGEASQQANVARGARVWVMEATPGAQGGAAGNDKVQVRVTEWPHTGPRAVMYFGGNAEDAGMQLPLLQNALPGHAIYVMHYRGYGASTGTPSEAGLQADALALFDKVHAQHPQVMVVGRSLGTGVAVRLASQRPVARLVLITPYNSLQEIAQGQFPWVPVSLLLQDKYESWRYAGAVGAPTLVIAAEHDEVIPMASTQALLTKFAPGAARMEVLAQADHNNVFQHPRLVPLLRGD